jgi:hypothetical protein
LFYKCVHVLSVQSTTRFQVTDLGFRQARDKAIPLSGPILQSKALEFASQLDIADFKASNGHEKYPATGYKSNSRSVT